MADAATDVLKNVTTILKNNRVPFESDWQEIVDLCLPFVGSITTKQTPGSRRPRVLDSTATFAADRYVNGLKSTMVPKNTQWLGIMPPLGFDEDREVLGRLNRSSRRMIAAVGASNFYVEYGFHLTNHMVLGNGLMSVQETRKRRRADGSTLGTLVFDAIAMRDVWWSIGEDRRPNIIMREIEMPALDAEAFFTKLTGKDSPPASVSKVADKNPTDMVTVRHFVYESGSSLGRKTRTPTQKKWACDWFIVSPQFGAEELVHRGGWDILRYIPSRNIVVNREDYSRGRGHIIRPEAKRQNKLMQLLLIAGGRDIVPYVMVPDDSDISLDARPGGLAIYRAESEPPKYLTSGTDYNVWVTLAQEGRSQILQGMLVDSFEEPETEARSAFESQRREVRRVRQLSSSSDIIIEESLNPVVRTVAEIMLEANALPELEEALDLMGVGIEDLELRYRSPFFTAQKAQTALNTQAYVDQIIERFRATQREEILDAIHFDRTAEIEGVTLDVPSEVLTTQEEREEIRQARLEALQLEQAQEVAQGVAALQRGPAAPREAVRRA